jgi:hypothetical protein
MSSAEQQGYKEARWPRGYSNPYKNEHDRAEWQQGYERGEAEDRAAHQAEHALAERSLYQVIEDEDFAEALRRIAKHVGMDLYA